MDQGLANSTNHIFTDLDFSQDFEIREQVYQDLNRRIAEAPIDTQEALASFVADADPYQQKVIDAGEKTQNPQLRRRGKSKLGHYHKNDTVDGLRLRLR